MFGRPRVNMVLVPLVLRMALCKLATSAHGPAKHELMEVLDYSRKKFSSCKSEITDTLSIIKDSDMMLMNKMYVNYTKDIDPKFLADSTEHFGVHVEKVDINRPSSVVGHINAWFDARSYKRLPDILSPKDVNKQTSILLVSAAHIKTTWEKAFNVLLTKKAKFKGMHNKVTEVEMMTKVDSILFYNDNANNFKIATLYFMWNAISITFILPDMRDGLPALLSKLGQQSDVLQNAKTRMKRTRVEFSLPRFKIKTNLDLDDYLKLMGVNQVYNSTLSGLDGILKSHKDSEHIYLSKAKQKVFLEVDEFGVLRSPSRAKEDEMSNAQLRPGGQTAAPQAEFLADHPFFFMLNLQLNPSGGHSEFALGVYYGPE